MTSLPFNMQLALICLALTVVVGVQVALFGKHGVIESRKVKR